MRPEALYPLFAPVTSLPGIGPRLAKLVERAAGPHIIDLLWHLPVGLIERRPAASLREAPVGAVITLALTVDAHESPAHPRQPYRVRVRDASGFASLVFFHAKGDYLAKALPVGEVRVVSGRLERYGELLQMVHPDHIVPEGEAGRIAAVEPVYPMTEGLTPRVLRKAVEAALARAPALPEWQEPAWLGQQGWPAWREALFALHNPAAQADLAPAAPARRRVAYDELLASQVALALMRVHRSRARGRPVAGDGRLRGLARAALPYVLTGAQERALSEIAADLGREARMLRLLQGDVGSGKTVVAALAMLMVVEAGCQAALMAPTEILARQHLATLERVAGAAGVPVALVLGRGRAAERKRTLAGLADGSIPLAVGTHALFQEDVAFRDLALAVVDEQHRFGVHQRMLLADKGRGAHVLVTTATPIPRTLQLAAFGDLDVSVLDEKPAGRSPVATRVLPVARLDEVVEGVRRALAKGSRCYWVCPLVAESEQVDLAAAEQRHRELKRLLGAKAGLVHGRMAGPERDRAVAAFAKGELAVLVATTVIEVGVDVPEADIMVVEHAERFGLAQLHQLRGRIGRGGRPSTCILVYTPPLGATAKERLSILRATDDGFRIAEEDLRLRGGGEILGTRQSGDPAFRIADLAHHADLLAAARDDARLILARDEGLESPRGRALRHLLYLFERDQAVRLLRSG